MQAVSIFEVAVDFSSGSERSASLAPGPYHLASVRRAGKHDISGTDESKIWMIDQDDLAIVDEEPNMAEHDRRGFRGLLLSRSGIALLGFLAVAGFLLWEEHAAHILGYLPLILILGLCLGMHFFMHGGHGGDHGSERERPTDG